MSNKYGAPGRTRTCTLVRFKCTASAIGLRGQNCMQIKAQRYRWHFPLLGSTSVPAAASTPILTVTAAGPSLQFLVPTRGVEPRPPRSQRGMHNRYTCAGIFGWTGRIRTFNLRIQSALRCQLRHHPIRLFGQGPGT